jgi:hypothetical protein
MKTLITKNGTVIDVRRIECIDDNAKILNTPYHYGTRDYVEGFQVSIKVDAILPIGAQESFTVILQSAERLDKLAHGLANMWFAQHYGADWDESGKLAKFVGYEYCYKAWDEIAEFLISLAESKCRQWYDDNKDTVTN